MFKKRLNGEEGNISSRSTTIIAGGTIFRGDISSNDSLRIDGEVNGDIESSEKVIVGPEGKINGNIRGREILISGTVKGNIFSREGLILKAKSLVDGDIVTTLLSVEPEAIFKGSCNMDGESTKASKKEEHNKKQHSLLVEAMPN